MHIAFLFFIQLSPDCTRNFWYNVDGLHCVIYTHMSELISNHYRTWAIFYEKKRKRGYIPKWHHYGRYTQFIFFIFAYGKLSTARHIYEVLTPHMLPAMNLRRDVFQHDNARSHTARATVDFLVNQNVTVLPGRLNR
jgi:hypothetical protein